MKHLLIKVGDFTYSRDLDLNTEGASKLFTELASVVDNHREVNHVELAHNPREMRPNNYKHTSGHPKSTTDSAPKKLVVVGCSCGESIIKFTNEPTIKCFKCNTIHDINYDSLVRGNYDCPNCGTKGYVNIQADDSACVTVNCKGCNSPIDLMYHKKKGKFLSTNKLK